MASRAWYAFVRWNVPDKVKTGLVVGGFCGLATWQTLKSTSSKKDGHALMSSEKPQAMRKEVQERDIEAEKARLSRNQLKGETAAQRAMRVATGELKLDDVVPVGPPKA